MGHYNEGDYATKMRWGEGLELGPEQLRWRIYSSIAIRLSILTNWLISTYIQKSRRAQTQETPSPSRTQKLLAQGNSTTLLQAIFLQKQIRISHSKKSNPSPQHRRYFQTKTIHQLQIKKWVTPRRIRNTADDASQHSKEVYESEGAVDSIEVIDDVGQWLVESVGIVVV